MMTVAAALYVSFAILGLYGWQQGRPLACFVGTVGGFCVWLYCHLLNRARTRELQDERRRHHA